MPNRVFTIITISFFSFFIVCCQSPANSSNEEAINSNEQSDTSPQQSEPRDLSPVDFRNKIDRTPDGVLLDVRTETERLQVGFMIDSKHLDFYRQDFNDQLEKLDKDKTYFVYCRSGARSGKTVDQLRKNGYKAYNLKGGFMEWKKTFPF